LFLIHEFYYLQKGVARNKDLFCLWHVKKTWHKQTCVKVRDVVDLQA
jgi:hypothetical protein